MPLQPTNHISTQLSTTERSPLDPYPLPPKHRAHLAAIAFTSATQEQPQHEGHNQRKAAEILPQDFGSTMHISLLLPPCPQPTIPTATQQGTTEPPTLSSPLLDLPTLPPKHKAPHTAKAAPPAPLVQH